MRKCAAMKVTMVLLVLASIQFAPSSAQQSLPGDCWKDIATCTEGAATPEAFHDECCPVLMQVVSDETMCFCGVGPILEQDTTAASEVAQLLQTCHIDNSFDQVCNGGGPAASAPETPSASAPAPSLPCWDDMETCISNNIEKAGSMQEFNVSSPMFNVTEFLCCSLVKETAATEKPCFCGVTALLDEQPSMTPNIMQVVAGCGIAKSVLALDKFCEGVVTPSLAPGPMTPSGSILAPSPAPTGDKTADKGAANKIVIAGSLSTLLVLLLHIVS